jgi:peptidoglycan/LPS O-acetylase OafA/YrhL
MTSIDILEREAPEDTGDPRWMVVAFTAASFLGAFLLFQLEPMMAKMLLPSLGGSAAVWNTAMVFFQVALVLGYALAHVSLRRLRPARHVALQLTLLLTVVLTLPVALPATSEPPVGGDPVWWTLLACLVIRWGAVRSLPPPDRRCSAGSPSRPIRVLRIPISSTRRGTRGACWRC